MDAAYDKTDSGSPGIGTREQVREKAEAFKDDVVDKGRDYLERRKSAAADVVGDFADALDAAAGELENRNRQNCSSYVRSASREVKRWSSTLRDQGVEGMTRQLSCYAGQHPGLFLGGAVLAGFTITRILKSSGRAMNSVPEEGSYHPRRADYHPSAPEGVVHHG